MSNEKNISRALQDIRKMRRSVKMRDQDAETVADTLETIMREAITVNSTSDGTLSRGALKELKQVRRSLVAGQIDAGAKTGEYIAKFSGVLDQLSNIENEMKEGQESLITQSVGTLRENIPSSETITSAVMTANPILGYTMKIGGDLMKSRRESKKRSQEQHKKRLELLKQQEQVLKQESETEKKEQEAAESSTSSNAEGEGFYERSLQSIQQEIKRLNEILGASSETLERIEEGDNGPSVAESTNIERIEETNESLEKNNDVLERLADTEKDNAERLERRLDMDQMKNREAELEGKGAESLTGILPDGGSNDGNGGLTVGMLGRAGGIAGLVGGMVSGLMTMAGAILKPFVGLLNFFKTGGSMLARFGKFTGLLAVIMGIVDFFNGFFGASDYLDKEANDIGWKDRIKVGISNVISGLIAPIDWVAEQLGMDLFEGDKDDLTKRLAQGFDGMVEDAIQSAKDTLSSISSAITDSISSINNAVKKWIDEKTKEWVPDFVRDFFVESDKAVDREQDTPHSFSQGGSMAERELRRRRLEEEQGRSAASRAADSVASEGVSREQGQRPGPPMVNAPNNSQTNISNKTVHGSKNTDNQEPTHRRFTRQNSGPGFLSW